MNLEKEMEEYVLKEVSVWNNDGNEQKFLPQQDYLNLCEAISIAEEYAEEMCKRQREFCAGTYLHNNGTYMDSEAILTSIENAPLATEEK